MPCTARITFHAGTHPGEVAQRLLGAEILLRRYRYGLKFGMRIVEICAEAALAVRA